MTKSKYKNYNKPPIIEAAIELRYKFDVEEKHLKKIVSKIGQHYEFIEDDTELQIEFDSNKKTESRITFNGKRFSSKDRTDNSIFRRGSFICARLAPYCGWEEFFSRAQRDWSEWRKIIGRVDITRIGVRFINRVDMPHHGDKTIRIEDYLHISPNLPDQDLPPISRYTIQVILPLGVDDCRLMINSQKVPSPLVDHISLVLDIDISRDRDLPLRDDKIWEIIDKIRDHKNRVFESMITDAARRLFNQ